jgi:hypothetical protein
VPAQFPGEQDGPGRHLVDAVHGEQLLTRFPRHLDKISLMPLAHDGDPGGLVQHQHRLVVQDHAPVPDLRPLAHPAIFPPAGHPGRIGSGRSDWRIRPEEVA